MNGYKGLLESRTVLAGIAVVIAGALSLLGYDVDASLRDLIADQLGDIITVAGGVVAIYGRVKATRRIASGPPPGFPPPPAIVVLAALLLTGCATGPAAMTPNECLRRAAAAETGITQALGATEKMFSSGMIDGATVKDALHLIGGADLLVNSAADLCPLDEPTAIDYLEQAGRVLIEVNQLLQE